MIGLMFLAILGAALWGLVIGIKFAFRAFKETENRVDNILRAGGGLLLAGFLTYPVFLGPMVARVACASGVGLEIPNPIDLHSNGYLVDWLPSAGNSFMEQGVEDLLVGRIAFFETSSFYREAGLQRVLLGPDDSRNCINPGFLTRERRLPRGMCLTVQRVDARQSKYDIETSGGFWRPDSFQKSIALVDHADERTKASYTFRRIPMAQLGFATGDMAVYCPRDAMRSRLPPWYGLTASALIASGNSAGGAEVAADAKGDQQKCVLPPLPETFEVHRYKSYGGRHRIDIQLDNSGSVASENYVYVNRPGVPVVLLLSSYNPVLWRIRQTPDSQIVAVLAESWGSAAAVTGVRANTPLLISSKNYGRMSNCLINEPAAQLYRVTHRTASDVDGDKHYASGDEVIPFVIGPKLSESAYEEYDGIPESRYTFTEGLPAGAAGVDYLVSTGAARILTQEDIQSLRQQKLPLATAVGRPDGPAGLFEGNSVILLRATRLPDGMYGAGSRTFIIPRGVPAPFPPLGHNEFLTIDADCSHSPCQY